MINITVDDTPFSTASYSPLDRTIYLPFAVDQPPLVAGCEAFAAREWHALIQSMLRQWHHMFPTSWLIAPGAETMQDCKLYLLSRAARVVQFLQIPATSVGTTFADIFASRSIVAKAINMWQEVAPGRYFNTALLPTDLADSIMLRGALAPSMLQEFIPHSRELRVYYSHGAITAVEITESSADPPIDFRLVRKWPEPAVTVQTTIPDRLASDVRLIANHLMLDYVVCDIACSSRDTYFLLDVNPIGSWQYFDSEFDVDITAELLTNFIDRTNV